MIEKQQQTTVHGLIIIIRDASYSIIVATQQ